MACPMAIDIAAIMDALRQIALERQVPVAEPGILGFHREVLNTVARYGRTHKLEIMLRYKVRTRDWFSDMDVGLKMLAKRKLDLMPSRVKNIAKIKASLQWPVGRAKPCRLMPRLRGANKPISVISRDALWPPRPRKTTSP